jgi:nucleotide-binding universal stress UspA family protein
MFETVLVPLDGSEYSERALATGLELARLTGGKVRLITVVLAYPDAHVPAVRRLDQQTRRRAEVYLEPFIRKAQSNGFDIDWEVAHGEPAQEILRAANAAGAGVIVMSTHGIGAGGRHALGSVAMKVLEAAECPVLLVKIPQGSSA